MLAEVQFAARLHGQRSAAGHGNRARRGVVGQRGGLRHQQRADGDGGQPGVGCWTLQTSACRSRPWSVRRPPLSDGREGDVVAVGIESWP